MGHHLGNSALSLVDFFLLGLRDLSACWCCHNIMSGCDKSVLQCSCSDTVRCGCGQTAQVNHKSLLFSFVCLLLWFSWFADLFLLILMRATSITWAIGRGGGGGLKSRLFWMATSEVSTIWDQKSRDFQGPHPLPMARVMDLPTSKSLSPSAFGLGLGTDLIYINWVIFWRSWCSVHSWGLEASPSWKFSQYVGEKYIAFFGENNVLVQQTRFRSEPKLSTSLDPDSIRNTANNLLQSCSIWVAGSGSGSRCKNCL